ncbi:hypothetical protein FOZ63_020016 [Perkinsus olseni]|uniref:Uncharacterized protein n=1 Tax=Perkinsus olseni TaxID=32597 RepID=A0A7J6PY74_PEROL|nr:hypothetical protein FOZ63_020016 [Perkinsus olseni]
MTVTTIVSSTTTTLLLTALAHPEDLFPAFNTTSGDDGLCGRQGSFGAVSGEDRDVMELMCEYWPEDKWGPIGDSDLDEVASLAETGELGRIREKSVEWTESFRSSPKFCWRKLMKKRENRKAMCDGPGLSGNRPGFGWKCKRNCREFCKDEFHNYFGKTHRMFWCKCPMDGSFGRMIDPPCSHGESLMMGKCYQPCPAGMEPSLIRSRCSTDCSQNTNGLVKTCGLGCARSSFDCGTAVGAMVATVGASVLGVSAEFAPPLVSSALLGLSKMIALIAEIIDGLSNEIRNLVKGHGLNVGRLVMMGAMMHTYFTEMDSNPETLLKGARPYSESVQGLLAITQRRGKARFKAGVRNLMGRLQDKFGAVTSSIMCLLLRAPPLLLPYAVLMFMIVLLYRAISQAVAVLSSDDTIGVTYYST